MPIVDAHAHIYSPDRDAYPAIDIPWEPGEPASAEDLKKKMDVTGVDRAVFIQTSTFYGHDNRYIMASASEHAEWACGVVTLDPDNESHIDLLEDAVANSNIRGMRGTTDSINRISSPNVYRLWSKAMELGIPVNCMVMDDLDRVPEIERIAQDLGGLKIVIDHCFMLNSRQRTEETLVALERLANVPNIYAKLTSGSHGSYRVYPFEDMHDPLKRVIEAFGPSRCVWGSNFPNALWSKGASYAQNLHLFVKELGLSLPEKADILGAAAMSLWFPQEHESEQHRVREQQARTEREAIGALADDLETEEDTSEQVARANEVTNIAELLQGENQASTDDDQDGDTGAADTDGDLDVSVIIDAANQLNAVLGEPDSPAAEVSKKAGAGRRTSAGSPEPEEQQSDDPQILNVEELLAAQNYTPIDTAEIGQQDQQTEPPAEPGDVDDLPDSSGIDDVADQLNAMLESVEEIAADIADVAADAENEVGLDERDSA